MYERTTTASRRQARAESTRYLHVSCEAYMRRNPLLDVEGAIVPRNQWAVPYVGFGSTYNVGRNKAKREAKAKAAA